VLINVTAKFIIIEKNVITLSLQLKKVHITPLLIRYQKKYNNNK